MSQINKEFLIRVQADLSGAQKKLDGLTRKLQSQSGKTTKINVTADIAKASQRLDEIKRRLADAGKGATIPVSVDTAKALQQFNAINERVSQFQKRLASTKKTSRIGIEADISAAQKDLLRLEILLRELKAKGGKIPVEIDTGTAKKKLALLNKELRDSKTALQQQGSAAKSTQRALDPLGNSYDQLRYAAAAYISLAGVQRALKAADEFKILQAQLKIATQEQGDFNTVFEDLFEISNRNGVALRDTTDLFIKMARVQDDLGATRAQVLELTASIQQMGIISGATDLQLANSLRQFSQAMAGGILRAEEFNSIIENTPFIAAQLAKGLNASPAILDKINKGLKLTQGDLRLLVVDGKILSRDVFAALLTQSKNVGEEFEQFPKSLGRAFLTLTNSTQKFLGQLDKTLGVTNTIATSLEGWAGLIEGAANALSEFDDNDIDGVQRRLARLTEQMRLFNVEGINEQSDLFRRLQYRSVKQALEETTKRYVELNKQKLKTVDLDKLIAEGAAAGQPAAEPEGDGDGDGDNPRVDPNERAIKSLELEAKTFNLAAREATLYRLRVEGASKAQLARAAAALTTIDRLEQEKQAQQDLTEALKQAEQDRAAILEQAAGITADLPARLAAATGDSAGAALLRLQQDFAQTIGVLHAAGDSAGVALAQELFSVDQARIQFDALAKDFAAVQAKFRGEIADVQAAVEIGTLTDSEGVEKVIALQQQMQAQLQVLVPKMRELATALGPEAVQQVDDFARAIANIEAPASRAQVAIKQGLAGAFTDFFENVQNGVSDIGDLFRDLYTQITGVFSRLIAEQLGQQLAKSLMPSGGAGGAGVFAFLTDIFAGSFHQGGIVGRGGQGRRVSPLLFAGAERYHSGGIPGLAPNEQPIIVQRDEEILTRQDPRHALNGGAQALNMPIYIQPVDQAAANALQRNRKQLGYDLGRQVNKAMGDLS